MNLREFKVRREQADIGIEKVGVEGGGKSLLNKKAVRVEKAQTIELHQNQAPKINIIKCCYYYSHCI